jgi:hypothetical protein
VSHNMKYKISIKTSIKKKMLTRSFIKYLKVLLTDLRKLRRPLYYYYYYYYYYTSSVARKSSHLQIIKPHDMNQKPENMPQNQD